MSINFRAVERSFDVKAYCENQPHKQYEGNIAIRCPVCEKEDKLWVLCLDKPDGTKAGAWTCYYCDEGGTTVISLIMRVEQLSKFEAMRFLRDSAYRKDSVDGHYGDLRELVLNTLSGVTKLDEKWENEPLKPLPLPREFKPYNTYKHPAYFDERKITKGRAVHHGLGWCEEGYFRNRIIVPVKVKGKVVFFVARWMKAKPPKDTKKTIYPKGSKVGRVLFNFDRARHHKQIVLTEDVFSAMAVGNQGVATFGTSLSQYHLELLLSSDAEEIVIMWDNDAIGKAKELAVRLSEFYRVRVVELPDARDPDEYDRTAIRKMISKAPVLDSTRAFSANIRSRISA